MPPWALENNNEDFFFPFTDEMINYQTNHKLQTEGKHCKMQYLSNYQQEGETGHY